MLDYWKWHTIGCRISCTLEPVTFFPEIFIVLGGVGWAATQLANLAAFDVKVYGIASESKHDEIIKNGVLVALTHDNFSSRLIKPEFDIIIDNVGGVSTKRSMALLKPLGRIILTG